MHKKSPISLNLAAYAKDAADGASRLDDLDALAVMAEAEEMPSLAESARWAKGQIEEWQRAERAVDAEDRLVGGEALKAALSCATIPEA